MAVLFTQEGYVMNNLTVEEMELIADGLMLLGKNPHHHNKETIRTLHKKVLRALREMEDPHKHPHQDYYGP